MPIGTLAVTLVLGIAASSGALGAEPPVRSARIGYLAHAAPTAWAICVPTGLDVVT